MKSFINTFRNVDSGVSAIEDAEECVNNELKGAQTVTRSISNFQRQMQSSMDLMAEANDYDMKLYNSILDLSNG